MVGSTTRSGIGGFGTESVARFHSRYTHLSCLTRVIGGGSKDRAIIIGSAKNIWNGR